MKDGTDEESAYATRMDEWVAWETRRGRKERGEGQFVWAGFSISSLLLYGVLLPPRPTHSAPVEVGGTGLLTNFFAPALLFDTYPLRMTPLFYRAI